MSIGLCGDASAHVAISNSMYPTLRKHIPTPWQMTIKFFSGCLPLSGCYAYLAMSFWVCFLMCFSVSCQLFVCFSLALINVLILSFVYMWLLWILCEFTCLSCLVVLFIWHLTVLNAWYCLSMYIWLSWMLIAVIYLHLTVAFFWSCLPYLHLTALNAWHCLNIYGCHCLLNTVSIYIWLLWMLSAVFKFASGCSEYLLISADLLFALVQYYMPQSDLVVLYWDDEMFQLQSVNSA